MPTNLYGPGDNYHSENSHVIPALIQRFHEAKKNHTKEVVIWGTGTPRREFLYVDDLASASVFVMNMDLDTYFANTKIMQRHINVGYGEDITIAQLAGLIARIVDYPGNIVFDSNKPDGAPKKLMDTSILNKLGWIPKINLETGIKLTYAQYIKECN
jgi:GDP-L-fucose synthase